MEWRINELKTEMKQAAADKETIQKFISEHEEIPQIILDILQQKIRRLKIDIEDCEIRLQAHEEDN